MSERTPRIHFHIITLFPDLFAPFCQLGVFGQALGKGLMACDLVNPREWGEGKHRVVDDRPYGGGDGMVMMAPPLEKALSHVEASFPNHSQKVIYLSPQGAPLTDKKARELAQCEGFTLICGRYSGIDQRFINRWVTEEISIGDYVVSGGEIPAMALLDAVSRYVPGVLGNEDSPYRESFAEPLLEQPLYTRPREHQGVSVPEILLSGDHRKIEQYCEKIRLVRTLQRRPELLKNGESQLSEAREFLMGLTDEERATWGLEGEIH